MNNGIEPLTEKFSAGGSFLLVKSARHCGFYITLRARHCPRDKGELFYGINSKDA
nr:MAG TPA_asm: hypothetical protein [Caudoviricetes sp.]